MTKDVEPWTKTNVIGKPLPRIDAYERVSGTAIYTMDLKLPEMLHAAILRCPHSHARVRNIDVSAARKIPGVQAVVSNATPEAGIPWYFTEKGPTSRLFDPHCRYQGEEVAAVAAENLEAAYDAIRSIVVDYELLPFISDMQDSLKPNAPEIHTGGNQISQPEIRERGDLADGFKSADYVLEETYRTACQIHTPTEAHCSVASWDGNRLTVWDSTQGVFTIREQLAQVFRLPLSSVRVISHYMGGGFGSKLEVGKYTAIAAVLARMTGRPVKCSVPREDMFTCVGNRPPNILRLKAGARKDGSLTALDMTILGTGGAYPDDGNSGFMVADLYLCPNVRVEEQNVYVNAGKLRAFRAPGFPQCAWALEQMMDALAEKIGMDPVEFRTKNIPSFSQVRGNKPYTSTGLKDCLTEGAKRFGWEQARGKPKDTGPVRRGVGVAACSWGYPGGPPATAIVKLFADGSAGLNTGASDLGTGTKTVLAMVIAEELGVALKEIQIEHADTATTQYAPLSGGSQTILVNAPAVREAALDVRMQVVDLAAAELQCSPDDISLKDGKIVVSGKEPRQVAFSDLKSLAQQQVLIGVGHRGPNPADKVPIPFAAQFAEVEVNVRTGEVKVVRLLAAHDSGRVMNALTYENQVFGGMTMALGFALTEGRILDANHTGRMANANWRDYKIPTAMDVPLDMTCVPIDPQDRECNTTGAKGLGEPATIPTAAAVANAVYHATGIRVKETPISPMQMLALLDERNKGGVS